ncbi:tryptophan synthase subunit alpha [Streptomyces sp. NPDC001657]|uniref:tryptophan synthase subunit alpha n=1 Tax=Streptomyces sp. NPDC001657 TaxID=3154522 RepID=UPI003320F5C0
MTVFAQALHAHLFGLPADDGPLPTALDALLQATHTATAPEQQTPILRQLADQLRSGAEIIQRYQYRAHWDRLPADVAEQLRDAHDQAQQVAQTLDLVAPAFSSPPTTPVPPGPQPRRAAGPPAPQLHRPDATTDLPRQHARRERHPLATTDPLHTLLAQPHCALGVFVPAGLRTATAERQHLDQLAQVGADLFEVGLATEDAFLDGPVIQAAYHRALRRGNVLDAAVRAIEHAAGLRPTVVMTYWEPVSRHEPEHLARLFADAGAAGVMVVDLPADQTGRWHDAATDAGLHTPRLIPRTTPAAGLPAAIDRASGWLYAPASTAPTGYRGPLDIPALADFTQRLRAASPLPVVSGVGISTPALATRVAPLVDAVVIGTPVVRALTTDPGQAPALIAAFAKALRTPTSTEPLA